MGKTVSQKKILKGVVASTGVTSEPPGTIRRISNLIFTARGSLQTIPGSAIVGQLPALAPIARAIGSFSNFSSGQYPYYPTIISPSGYQIPDVLPFTINFITDTGMDNPAGSYTFAVVASNNGSIHSNYVPSITTAVAATGFDSININWSPQVVFGVYYTLYYLPGGPNATQGVLITGPTLQNSGFFGGAGYVVPSSPLVSLTASNNSYGYSLAVGNIVPPSKQVLFTLVTAASIPAQPPQPASLSPGDPNFQFETGGATTSSYGTSGVGTSVTQSSPGSSTNTSSSTPAFPAVSIAAGQTISFSVNLSASVSGVGGVGGGSSSAIFQYSPDNAVTWYSFFTLSDGGTNYSESINQNYKGTVSGVTTLSDLLFRVQCEANTGGSASTSATGAMGTVTVTLTSSFSLTPYGGESGYACPIPQILQFNQLSILILGNGYQPHSFDPSLLSSATLTALSNTFQATFPNWQASVAWNQGDSIAVLISGTNYQFTAQQAGVSGASSPTFPATLGATVADGQIYWKNAGAITTSIAPRGAAHGIVYAGSLWLANTSPATTADNFDGPTCLKMSDSNNQNSWNPANVAFIGKDDGTQITGLASFTIAELGIAPTGSLVVFKEFSTYQILGVFGATDFQITQAQTDLGCIGPRTISFLPGYGICRLTHMGFSIFNGVSDTLISEEIRPYLFGGTGESADLVGIDLSYAYISQGVQCANPPMYLCLCPIAGSNGALSRMFVYDLVLKAWTILDLPWTVTALIQARVGEGSPLTLAARSDGTGAIERLFAGDQTWDAASLVSALTPSMTAISWSFSTAHVFREGSSLRAFFRRCVLRGYASQAVGARVTIRVEVNGNPFTTYVQRMQPQPTSKQIEIQVDLMLTAQIVQIHVSGTGVATIDAIDWDVTEKKGGQIVVG